MNHYRDNIHYINGLRTPKGGIDTAMLTTLRAPKAPRTGWIRRLASAPFPVAGATPEALDAFWMQDAANVTPPDWRECAAKLFSALKRVTPDCSSFHHNQDEQHEALDDCPALESVMEAMDLYEKMLKEENRT